MVYSGYLTHRASDCLGLPYWALPSAVNCCALLMGYKNGMAVENTIESNYTKERSAFLRRRFRFVYCPASVLLGCACMECPLKEKCVKCNPGNLLGIDHQTLTKDDQGNERFTFRPYKTSLDDHQRKALEVFCAYFKLRLEITDEVTYREGTFTVHITPTEDSLRFRKGGNVIGRPWYGNESLHYRYRKSMNGR